MAFRPRLSPCSISSRYGSQALADCCGWSVGGPWFPENDAPESVVTWYSLAGFEGSGSVVTPWPVLPALAVPRHPVVAPRSRLPSGKRLLFLDGHQWLARCAARAIRASPV